MNDVLMFCAADAAFRAVQLSVATPLWLPLHQKEGLYQEEKITARLLGRSHVIKEKEAKNNNSLCGGEGGSKMATKAVPLPQVGGSASKMGGSAIPHHVTDPKKRSARDAHGPTGPTRSHMTSVVGDGEKHHFFWRF
jgi:hypothetical protein